MGLLDKWNKNKFSIYKSEEKTVLKLIESIGKWVEDLIKETDNKTDLYGDHKGSWQGLNRPTLSEEGMRATVEQLIDVTIPSIDTQLAEKAKKYELIFSQEKLTTETDAQCLQRLINTLTTNGGTIVVDIDITVNQKIVLKSNVTVKGDSQKRRIKIADNANITCIFEVGVIRNSSIRNLTLDGNKTMNTTGSAIILLDHTANYYINSVRFSNLFITLFAEYGIYTASGRAIGLQCNDLEICYNEKSGLYSKSSDSCMYSINVYSCGNNLGYDGIELNGGNIKMSNVKVFKCGSIASATYGIKLSGVRSSMLQNIDVQENNYGGMLLSTSYNNVINCIADSNNNLLTSGDTYGIYLNSSYNNLINTTIYNQTNAKPQKNDIYLSRYSHDNIINYVSDNKDLTKIQDLGFNNTFNKEIFKNATKYTEKTTTVNGVTYTIEDDGILKISGTSTADSSFYYFGAYDQTTDTIVIPTGKTVKFSFIEEGMTGLSFIVMTDGVTSKYTISDLYNITLAEDITITGVVVKVASGTTINIAIKPKIMIKR